MPVIGFDGSGLPGIPSQLVGEYSTAYVGRVVGLITGIALPSGSPTTFPGGVRDESTAIVFSGTAGTTPFSLYNPDDVPSPRYALDYSVYRSGHDGLGSCSIRASISPGKFGNKYLWHLWNTNVEYGLALSVHILSNVPLYVGDGIFIAAYLDTPNSYHGAGRISDKGQWSSWTGVGTPTPLASGSGWTGTPDGYVAYKATVLVNPRRAGLIFVYGGFALSPYTAGAASVYTDRVVYICPRIEVTAAP